MIALAHGPHKEFAKGALQKCGFAICHLAATLSRSVWGGCVGSEGGVGPSVRVFVQCQGKPHLAPLVVSRRLRDICECEASVAALAHKAFKALFLAMCT